MKGIRRRRGRGGADTKVSGYERRQEESTGGQKDRILENQVDNERRQEEWIDDRILQHQAG